jgi:hypothetical protein
MMSQTGMDIKLRMSFLDNFETDRSGVSFGTKALMSEPEIEWDTSSVTSGASGAV